MAESTRVLVLGKISFDPVTGKIGDSEVYRGKLKNPGSNSIDVAIKRIPKKTANGISNPQSKQSPEQWKLTYLPECPTNIVRWYTNEEDDYA